MAHLDHGVPPSTIAWLKKNYSLCNLWFKKTTKEDIILKKQKELDDFEIKFQDNKIRLKTTLNSASKALLEPIAAPMQKMQKS